MLFLLINQIKEKLREKGSIKITVYETAIIAYMIHLKVCHYVKLNIPNFNASIKSMCGLSVPDGAEKLKTYFPNSVQT